MGLVALQPIESSFLICSTICCWQMTEDCISWQGMMHRSHKGADDYATQQQVLQEHLMQVLQMPSPAKSILL